MEQLRSFGRELAMGSQGGWGQSKEFLDFVKSIGEARSKAEEDRIVLTEIDSLKRRLADPDVPRRRMKEYIIRLVYVEMLGHDASFGYIHAVKMTHDDSLAHKRTGYLAVTLFLKDDHDLIILIVNTIQKDLKSDNYLVVCAALTAVCRLINEETIPAVLPQVVELLGHAKESIRKKAVMALHRFYQRSPATVSHLISKFRKMLCDNDPGVMGATLCPLFDLITEDPKSYKDLVMSFVIILKQVVERRLPKTYDYHQMPAPFIQIKLLKILALLGSGDKQASESMYTTLVEIFRKGESSSNIGNAVLYECICCVSSIYPNPKLLDSAAEATSKFLKSDSHNLRYMGIDALGMLIKMNPGIAEEHQLAVIDCLEDPDDTLKRKTFDLLYKMTKSTNVEVIVDRMVDYMKCINDYHYKTEIASRCVELAEQFAPSNHWFIQTMNKVFEHAGDLVNVRVAHNLMRLIAEGFAEDDTSADSQLRSSAVDSYLHILGEPKLPSVFLQLICWVLGEYGTADRKYSASYITGKLCDVCEAHASDDTVKGYAITAIMKVLAFESSAGRKFEILPECVSLINELSASHSTDLQQRAYELQALLELDAHAVESVMPSDASCEDIEVDKTLSFLNGYVKQSLENGARPYISENERSGVLQTGKFRHPEHEVPIHVLRFDAYELPNPTPPSIPPPAPSLPVADLVPISDLTYSRATHLALKPSSAPDSASAADTGVSLRLDGVQKKWGRLTYSSSSSSQPTSSSAPKAVNGAAHTTDGACVAGSQPRDSTLNSSRPDHFEVSAEKQKLAASLFGTSSSRSAKKQYPGHKPTRGSHGNMEKSTPKVVPPSEPHTEKSPPPDLLDLSEPAPASSQAATAEDPFDMLEGLMAAIPASAAPPTPVYSPSKEHGNPPADSNAIASIGKNSHAAAPDLLTKKRSNLQEALHKDVVARQVGVTPSGNNPNLFRDLLG